MNRTAFAAAVLLAAIAAPAAWAGPKDDVLQALARCADIADRDARAACFDAHTPELRAALAQPPVPATPAAAQPMAAAPPPSPAAVATAAPPASTADAPPPSRSQATTILSSLDPFSGSDSSSDTDRPSAAQMAYQPFGHEILPITIGAPQVDVQPGFAFTVTLANGQVWTEHQGHHEIPRFKRDGSDVVTIETGVLGGYTMYVRGSTGLFKVDRVK